MPARHLEDAVGELGGGQGAAPAARAARCAGQAGQLVQAALAAVLQQQGGVELLGVHQVGRLTHQPVRAAHALCQTCMRTGMQKFNACWHASGR